MKYPKILTESDSTAIVSKDTMVDVDRLFIERNIEPRICADSNLDGKAIWLNYAYDWRVGEDSVGQICLVPSKIEFRVSYEKN